MSLLYIITDIQDFNEVYQTTKQFSASWEDIGCILGITKYTINIIARNNSNDVTRCMSGMIETWLKRETPEQPLPTWSCLCNAIASVDLLLLQGQQTPLHWSSVRGHIDIVNALLYHDADIHVKDVVSKY